MGTATRLGFMAGEFSVPDDFDQMMLIAQAYDERLTLLTREAAMLELVLDEVVQG